MPRRARAACLAFLAAAPVLLLGAPPATATPGPADAPEYWFDRWQVSRLWASGALGQGVTIAEIDTGVNASLPELRGRILPGIDLGTTGNGHVDREINLFGHGTAMASIMVARPGLLGIAGLAPRASILPIAVPLDGTTDRQQPGQLPDAIRYAADHGAKIINLSVGGTQDPDSGTPCPTVEQQAVFYALAKGAVVIASVGNTGPTDNAVEEPAACLGVVAVGAVDEAGRVASFSGREPYLSLVAPGVNIPSLGRAAGDAFTGDGTSQATALVSASLALAWSRYPHLSGQQLIARLFATLDDARSTPSTAYGYGQLNAHRLLTAAVPATAANPVFAAAAPFRTRADELDHPRSVVVPPAADAPNRATGRYEVNGTPRITARVRNGLALCAVGVLALVGLLGLGLRRRVHRS